MEFKKLLETDHSEQAELTRRLIAKSGSYYGAVSETPDLVFDEMAARLKAMEQASGYAYEGSPNYYVGAETTTALPKVRHEYPALSLDKEKYKDRENLVAFMDSLPGGDPRACLSFKLDGMTTVLTYDNGKLTRAATRGDGTEGSDITMHAFFIKELPVVIPADGHIVIRGETLMTFSDFEAYNASVGGIYENPRNIVSGTLSLLDNRESRKRPLTFVAFELVAWSEDEIDRYTKGLELMKKWGFRIVPGGILPASHSLLPFIEVMKRRVAESNYPTDGLVLMAQNLSEAKKLGATGHHVRYAKALKWTDETAETTVREIEWSVGKTGAITPVACFDPVRLGAGSTVTRASLANVSVARNTTTMDFMGTCTCGVGSRAKVYLANMIIPKIAQATPGELVLPETCPVCGAKTVLKKTDTTEVLMCENPECGAKSLKKLATYASKDGANIEGLSETTIAALMDMGLVETPADFYTLKDHPDVVSGELAAANGWGEKSVANLLAAIEKSRVMDFVHFLYSLSVPLLGHDLSKKLNAVFKGDIDAFLSFVKDTSSLDLTAIEGIGPVKAENLALWATETMQDPAKLAAFKRLLSEVDVVNTYEEPTTETENGHESLAGLTFVITGAVYTYKNRAEFKASVESRGGKVAGSVSKKTDFLVTNDTDSGSSKNRKAAELGIPVLTEDEFIARFGF